MSNNIIKRFLEQLPLQIEILGRIVRLTRLPNGRVSTEISSEWKSSRYKKMLRGWEGRKGVWVSSAERTSAFHEMEQRMADDSTVKRFLKYYLATPVGPRVLLLSRKKKFSSYMGRMDVIDETFMTWDAITNWERTSSNQLRVAIACAGYRKRLAKYETDPDKIYQGSVLNCLCSSNTTDLTGLCPSHRNEEARTLFNYYPFFTAEGCSDLAF